MSSDWHPHEQTAFSGHDSCPLRDVYQTSNPSIMTQTQNILVWLRRLSDLDTVRRRMNPGSPELPAITSDLEAMRERLPTAILKHYDERRSRGKPAVAPVNGGICGGCHICLP